MTDYVAEARKLRVSIVQLAQYEQKRAPGTGSKVTPGETETA